MVSVLPGPRSPWDLIGSQIGANLQQVLPGAVQQGFQRQQGLNAIDQLQTDLASAGGDLTKILPALARAYTLNPALERSGLGQLATTLGQRTTAANPVLGAIDQQPEQGGQGLAGMAPAAAQAGQPIPAQGQVSPNQMAQPSEGLFLSDFIPVNIGKLISPEQQTNMLANVAKSGGDVELTRQLIKQYNEGQIGVNELANANVEKQAANVQRMLGFENQIRDKINQYVPESTSEAEKNIYYNMVRPALESKGVRSFADAWQKVSADIDNFRKLNEAYVKNIPEPQITGVSPAGEKQLRDSAKPIMKIDPLAYNMLEQAYTKKGHSPITPAQILKPLPQGIKKTISGSGDYKHLIYPTQPTLASTEFPERAMQRNIEIANREQQQEIPRLANSLRKQWDPDVSLLNIYTDLRRHAWSLPNIHQLFSDLSDLMSPRQQAEQAMLNQNLPIPTRYLQEE